MNKQEAIESIKKISDDLLEVKFVSLESVIDIVSQIHEPQKPVVPKYVAEWYDYAKKQNFSLRLAMENWLMSEKLEKWLQCTYNQETFALAWLDGYEVEKEPKYRVRMKNTHNYLFKSHDEWYMLRYVFSEPGTYTKSELKEAGFGGVFDNPMFETEEVEELKQ